MPLYLDYDLGAPQDVEDEESYEYISDEVHFSHDENGKKKQIKG